jgi:hypothetical protein
MKGSGRFGKYGDLKRKQRIRENRQTPPVGSGRQTTMPDQEDKRKKPWTTQKGSTDSEREIPASDLEPSGEQ